MARTAKARSPLFKAAERLDRIAREVKEKQFQATGVTEVPIGEPLALHPEEGWARRFATHAIRPVPWEGARPPLSSFVAPPADMPRMPVFQDPPTARLDQPIGAGHIGSALGKLGPRRSWLGRLLRGRDI